MLPLSSPAIIHHVYSFKILLESDLITIVYVRPFIIIDILLSNTGENAP